MGFPTEEVGLKRISSVRAFNTRRGELIVCGDSSFLEWIFYDRFCYRSVAVSPTKPFSTKASSVVKEVITLHFIYYKILLKTEKVRGDFILEDPMSGVRCRGA